MKNSINSNTFTYLPGKKVCIREIADKIGGIIIGDSSIEISGVSSINEPMGEASISFTDKTLESDFVRFTEEFIYKDMNAPVFPGIAALIVSNKANLPTSPLAIPTIKVDHPLKAIIESIELIYNLKGKRSFLTIDQKNNSDTLNRIHPSSNICDTTKISPFVTIGKDVSIGSNCIIHPNVTIYDNVRIGNNSIIGSGSTIREGSILGNNIITQSNVVIGSDGFGYVNIPNTGLVQVPQIGIAIIEDDVHIGANTCIDRATLGTTKIGKGTKIDNLVQIGHNNKIGSYCIICGKVGIAGSCNIGDGVVLGGGVRVSDHINITSGVQVGGASKVIQHITEPGSYAGFPPVKALEFKRRLRAISKLPELEKRVKNLEKVTHPK